MLFVYKNEKCTVRSNCQFGLPKNGSKRRKLESLRRACGSSHQTLTKKIQIQHLTKFYPTKHVKFVWKKFVQSFGEDVLGAEDSIVEPVETDHSATIIERLFINKKHTKSFFWLRIVKNVWFKNVLTLINYTPNVVRAKQRVTSNSLPSFLFATYCADWSADKRYIGNQNQKNWNCK